ncbi:TlpA family protein disulfide reductase [Echinicola marina]|uniref:TlpA family protein disulfide reductase n=1 Tax=Echinicola marina TaxID=2859768 RepID=UPI001CF63C0F|nr:TlpA disulfide reductase family protein [Echinicola marina]UCS92306.1 TlpA family protein disulfide reductase [Echinicola marina]
MKALTKNCFLALLCLFGSKLYAQVASPSATKSPENTPAPVVVYFEVRQKDAYRMDSLVVRLDDSQISGQAQKNLIKLRSGNFFEGVFPGSEGIAHIVTEDIKRPAYLSLGTEKNPFLNQYVVFPGDSIKIQLDTYRNQVVFSGPSAPLFRCQRELHLLMAERSFATDIRMGFNSPENLETYLSKEGKRKQFIQSQKQFGSHTHVYVRKEQDLAILESTFGDGYEDRILEVITRYQKILPADRLQVIKANYLGRLRFSRLKAFNNAIAYALRSGDPRHRKVLAAFFKDHEQADTIDDLPEQAIISSPSYQHYLITRAKSYAYLHDTSIFAQIRDMPNGPVKDHLAARYICEEFDHLENGDLKAKEALTFIDSPRPKEALQALLSSLGQGQALQGAVFTGLDGKPIDLSTLKGKVLLLDFWYTGCKACINFFSSRISKIEEHFKENPDFQMVSISADKDRARWVRSIESGRYTSHNALNLYTGGKGFQHSFLENMDISAFPRLILVEDDGTIRQAGGLKQPLEDMIKLIEEALPNKNNPDTLTLQL